MYRRSRFRSRRKRSYRRRRAPIRRRVTNGRRRISRAYNRNKVYSFKRFRVSQIINNPPVSLLINNYAPRLQDVPGFAEFTAMFGQYKIYGVKYEFIPHWNSQEYSTSVADDAGRFYVLPNYTSIWPTTEQGYQEAGCKPIYPGRSTWTKKLFVKPCVQALNFISAGLDNLSPVRRYLDTTDVSVPHYGVATGWFGNTDGAVIDVHQTYYVKFRMNK